eukprot:7446300-Lingulodinium_polyedra.AAC.1
MLTASSRVAPCCAARVAASTGADMRIHSRLVATMVACSPTPRNESWAPASMAVVRTSPGSRL